MSTENISYPKNATTAIHITMQTTRKRPGPTRTRYGRVRSTWRRGRRRRVRRGRRTRWRSASRGASGRRSWGSWSPCQRRWSAGSSAGWRRGPGEATRPPTGRPAARLDRPWPGLRRLESSSSSPTDGTPIGCVSRHRWRPKRHGRTGPNDVILFSP